MSVTSGFYNSLRHDRKYNAGQITKILDGVINDGVFVTIGSHFVVLATTGMTVSVGTGRAWFNQTWTDNDSPYLLTLAPSELILNRIDAVVIETNSSVDVRDNFIKVVKGIPDAHPAYPTLTNTADVHQYPLCYVYVGAGVTAITQEFIEQKVGTEVCPYVTGILQTSTVEVQTAAWEAKFNTWFDTLEYTLSGDVAGNLQNEVNDRVKYSDKASEADALAGISDIKYLTPHGSKKAIEKFSSPLGRIKIDTSKDPGSGWSLCNGARILENQLPELYATTNRFVNGGMLWVEETAVDQAYTIQMVNDYIVICRPSDSQYYLYRHKDATTWTTSSLIDATYTNCYTISIVWDGSKYLAYIATNNVTRIYYSTSINGPWTSAAYQTTENATGGKFVVVRVNGYHMFLWNYYNSVNYPLLSYSSDGITWPTYLNLNGATVAERPAAIFHDGTKYRVVTVDLSTNYLRIYSSTSPGSGYTVLTTNVYCKITAMDTNRNCVSFYQKDGTYIIGGVNTSSRPIIVYTTDFITFTTKQVSSLSGRVNNIIHDGTYWVASVGSKLVYCETLDGTWTDNYPLTIANTSLTTAYGLVLGNDELLLGSDKVYSLKRLLPKLSVPNAYAYIKSSTT